jgi:hypothetical protein
MGNNKHAFTGLLTPRKTIIQLGDHSEVHSDFYAYITLIPNTNTTIRALYVLEFRISLLSVRQLDKAGWTTTFGDGKVVLCNSKRLGSVGLTVPNIDNLYRFKLHQIEEAYAAITRSKARAQQQPIQIEETILEDTISEDTAEIEPKESENSNPPPPTLARRLQSAKHRESMHLWHRRLAHLHSAALKKLLLNSNIKMGETGDDRCDVCIRSKHAQRFERKAVARASKPFELIHSDLSGPFKTSAGWATYYIVYIDDHTRHTEVYFLATKSAPEVIARFKQLQAWVQTQ